MAGIDKAVVIGAGTMGSGIASHLANAGVTVYLLDVPSDSTAGRSAIAQQTLQRLLRAQPAVFLHPDCATRIIPGNIADDLHRVAEVDWIAEAVVERLEVKEQLYQSIEAHRKPGTPISSNTSTIPLRLLTRHMPSSFKRDFCITHFFNPVRYMQLLEIVAGPETRPETISQLTDFCDVRLGKGVVSCKDTPGFLGNRVGVFAIQVAIVEAIKSDLTIEEADAVLGRPIGWPKTGVFRLYDLIGLDLMLDVLESMRTTVPAGDPFRAVAVEIPMIRNLVEAGLTGNKGGGGFYRRRREEGRAISEAVDLKSGTYRPSRQPAAAELQESTGQGLRHLLEHPGRLGKFAWSVLSQSLSYAASLVPQISDSLVPIDEAMKLGFSWAQGPFEMIDTIGTGRFAAHLVADGLPVPPLLSAAAGQSLYHIHERRLQYFSLEGSYRNVERPPGVLRLSDQARTRRPRLEGPAASLWDIGEGVSCFEFHTKANALVPETMDLLAQAIDLVQRDGRALVIHNGAPHFSVGVNIEQLLANARREAWTEIESMLVQFQQTCRKLKYAPFPVVGAPSGMSLGGGFEILLHCDTVVAHTNNVTGLVEPQVGLVPAGGGCKEMLFRWSDASLTPPERAARVFQIVAPATIATSPAEAAPFRFVLPKDESLMNRDRLLAKARATGVTMAVDYRPPVERVVEAASQPGLAAIDEILRGWQREHQVTPYDLVVGRQLAGVLCGGDAAPGDALTEDRLFELERSAFMTLVKTPETLARIEHTLTTGKPLRN